jgi:cytochrome c biogenesis protein CcmG/thiol:disulfide interchange protein DsbE
MPSVQRVHEAFRASGVAVLAISIDGTGARAAKPVIDEGKFSFTAPIDQDMTVARKFGVRGVPMTYVIDRNGAVVAQGFGPMNLDAPAFRDFVKAVAARSSY